MLIKTIKLKENEFMDKSMLNDTQLHILVGARNSGKSYMVKNICGDIINAGGKIAYVRTREKELYTSISWLREIGEEKLCGYHNPYSLEITRGKPKRGDILLRVKQFDDSEIEDTHIGYSYSLEDSALIKSAFFQDVDCIVFEEFMRAGLNRETEEKITFAFAELIETVVRPDNNPDQQIPIFMITNAINGVSELELMFIDSPYATKYKIFKKRSDKGILSNLNGGISAYMSGETMKHTKPNLSHYNLFCTLKINGEKVGFFKHKFTNNYVIKRGEYKFTPTHLARLDLLQFINYIFKVNIEFTSDKDELFFKRNFYTIKSKLEGLFYGY